MFTAIFLLPFIGTNVSRGIVRNDSLGFKKDAAYSLFKNPRHNRRKFLWGVGKLVVRFLEVLTSERREKALRHRRQRLRPTPLQKS